jgi:hypothetical protein
MTDPWSLIVKFLAFEPLFINVLWLPLIFDVKSILFYISFVVGTHSSCS